MPGCCPGARRHRARRPPVGGSSLGDERRKKSEGSGRQERCGQAVLDEQRADERAGEHCDDGGSSACRTLTGAACRGRVGGESDPRQHRRGQVRNAERASRAPPPIRCPGRRTAAASPSRCADPPGNINPFGRYRISRPQRTVVSRSRFVNRPRAPVQTGRLASLADPIAGAHNDARSPTPLNGEHDGQ